LFFLEKSGFNKIDKYETLYRIYFGFKLVDIKSRKTFHNLWNNTNSLCLVKLFCKYSLIYIPSKKKKLEDAIGVIRNRKLQMDSQSNGQRKTSKNINNDLQNTTQKTGEWTKQTQYWHLSYYFCQKSGGKSSVQKGRDCDSNKGNIIVVICDTDIQKWLTKSCRRSWNFRSDDFNLITRNPWLSSFRIRRYHLSRKSW
jgi:hypothetical protein